MYNVYIYMHMYSMHQAILKYQDYPQVSTVSSIPIVDGPKSIFNIIPRSFQVLRAEGEDEPNIELHPFCNHFFQVPSVIQLWGCMIDDLEP